MARREGARGGGAPPGGLDASRRFALLVGELAFQAGELGLGRWREARRGGD